MSVDLFEDLNSSSVSDEEFPSIVIPDARDRPMSSLTKILYPVEYFSEEVATRAKNAEWQKKCQQILKDLDNSSQEFGQSVLSDDDDDSDEKGCQKCEIEVFCKRLLFSKFTCDDLTMGTSGYTNSFVSSNVQRNFRDINIPFVLKIVMLNPQQITDRSAFIKFLLRIICVHPEFESAHAAKNTAMQLLEFWGKTFVFENSLHEICDIILNFGANPECSRILESHLTVNIETKNPMPSSEVSDKHRDTFLFHNNLNDFLAVLPKVIDSSKLSNSDLKDIVLILLWLTLDKNLINQSHSLIKDCIDSIFSSLPSVFMMQVLPEYISSYVTSFFTKPPHSIDLVEKLLHSIPLTDRGMEVQAITSYHMLCLLLNVPEEDYSDKTKASLLKPVLEELVITISSCEYHLLEAVPILMDFCIGYSPEPNPAVVTDVCQLISRCLSQIDSENSGIREKFFRVSVRLTLLNLNNISILGEDSEFKIEEFMEANREEPFASRTRKRVHNLVEHSNPCESSLPVNITYSDTVTEDVFCTSTDVDDQSCYLKTILVEGEPLSPIFETSVLEDENSTYPHDVHDECIKNENSTTEVSSIPQPRVIEDSKCDKVCLQFGMSPNKDATSPVNTTLSDTVTEDVFCASMDVDYNACLKYLKPFLDNEDPASTLFETSVLEDENSTYPHHVHDKCIKNENSTTEVSSIPQPRVIEDSECDKECLQFDMSPIKDATNPVDTTLADTVTDVFCASMEVDYKACHMKYLKSSLDNEDPASTLFETSVLLEDENSTYLHHAYEEGIENENYTMEISSIPPSLLTEYAECDKELSHLNQLPIKDALKLQELIDLNKQSQIPVPLEDSPISIFLQDSTNLPHKSLQSYVQGDFYTPAQDANQFVSPFKKVVEKLSPFTTVTPPNSERCVRKRKMLNFDKISSNNKKEDIPESTDEIMIIDCEDDFSMDRVKANYADHIPAIRHATSSERNQQFLSFSNKIQVQKSTTKGHKRNKNILHAKKECLPKKSSTDSLEYEVITLD